MAPDTSRQRISLWAIEGFTATMVAVAAAFGAWSLLLPVVPTQVLAEGGSPTLAGLSTGVFMAATVATQVLTPWMLRTFGYKPVMAGAALMLGVPALGHLVGVEPWAVLTFSGLRGIGFGALTVAEAALMAELVPIRYLGKATGLLGVFVGGSQMLFLPVGLAMAERFGFDSTYYLAAVLGLIGFAVLFLIPSVRPAAYEPSTSATSRHVAAWKLVLVPALALTTISMSYGAISTFLPATVLQLDGAAGATLSGILLSVVGGSAMVFRYGTGVVADRTGQPGKLYIPGQFISLAGIILLAVVVYFSWSPWWLLLAAVLFGGGFGVTQQEALLSMFARLPRHQTSLASAVWNIFFDAGTGLGAVVLAAVIVGNNYAGIYAAGALIICAGIGLTLADFVLGRHRISEYDNIKTRLQRMRKL